MDVQAVTCDPWGSGGKGCAELAEKVAELSAKTADFKTLYNREDSIESKLLSIVQKNYGGKDFELSEKAKKSQVWLEKNGFGDLPVCVAKTQSSFSHDPTLLNAPKDFTLQVRELKLSAGAGFIVAICGDIMLMPGLGKAPTAHLIDVDDNGKITGLF